MKTRTLVIAAIAAVLAAGCGEAVDRRGAEMGAASHMQSAWSVYAVDAAYMRGYVAGLRDAGGTPEPKGGAR